MLTRTRSPLPAITAAAVLTMSLAACTAPPEPAAEPIDVVGLDATAILEALEEGRTTSVELVAEYQSRIAAYEFGPAGINALTTLNPAAVADAVRLDVERAAGEVRGPLHGVPVVVKDVIDVFGLPTTGSNDAYAELVPDDDATQVERLREAGAIILGKTNVVDIDGTQIGAIGGVTRNPYDLEHHAGFSSGGAGAAVAAAFAPLSIGEDTFGSVRIPASVTGLVGLRPTIGLSSADGLQRLTWTYDTLGPLAASVRDVALVMDVTAGYDPGDPVSDPDAVIPDGGYVDALSTEGLEGRTIGLLSDLLLEDTQAQTQTSVLIRAAAADMEALGAEIVEVSLPEDVQTSFDEIGRAIIGSEIPLAFNAYLDQKQSAVARREESGIPQSEIAAARETQESFRDGLLALLADRGLDALLYPAMQQPASEIGVFDDFVIEQYAAKAGVPALTVPAGLVGNLPVGLELLGAPYSEADLLTMGYAYEQATQHRTPPSSTPTLP